MKRARRTFLQFAGAAVAAPAFSGIATAQAYPSRPITMIVPAAVGGSGDVTGRIVAERMKKLLGQPIIIENVTGAEGSIGVGRAARARADGYSIALGAMSTHVLNGGLYSLPYDVLNDFAPISPMVTYPFVLFARRTTPAQDLKELIAWLKANPNKASAGIPAAVHHLATRLFWKETGTQFTFVPYRGDAPAIQDLVAGQIDLSFIPPNGLPLMQAGNIKAYAVTSDTRLAPAPDIPTFAETGLPALSLSNWMAIFAPKGTPRDIIDKLNAAAVEALGDPAVRSRLAELGMEVFPREQQTPEALATLQKADAEKWLPIIRELGMKAD